MVRILIKNSLHLEINFAVIPNNEKFKFLHFVVNDQIFVVSYNETSSTTVTWTFIWSFNPTMLCMSCKKVWHIVESCRLKLMNSLENDESHLKMKESSCSHANDTFQWCCEILLRAKVSSSYNRIVITNARKDSFLIEIACAFSVAMGTE